MKICHLRISFLVTALLFICACSEKEPVKAAPSPGELVFNKNCKVCHAQGINGAPIIGNKAMWGPRIEKGEAVLINHALNGFGLMPARGGKNGENGSPLLPDQDVKLAVKYMMSKAQ